MLLVLFTACAIGKEYGEGCMPCECKFDLMSGKCDVINGTCECVAGYHGTYCNQSKINLKSISRAWSF